MTNIFDTFIIHIVINYILIFTAVHPSFINVDIYLLLSEIKFIETLIIIKHSRIIKLITKFLRYDIKLQYVYRISLIRDFIG